MWYIILILIIIIMILETIKKKQDNTSTLSKEQETVINTNYNEKYIKKQYLLTQTELKFYKLLKNITDELDLIICPQVSLYEIVKNIEFKDFNKIQNKCIDFVITEQNLKIKFCIELDDYSHTQTKRIRRDEFVNKLFNDLDIKLIRIPTQNFYNLDELKNKIKESIQ